MKEFVAQVAKKLPQPQKLRVEGKIRKSLIMTFVCPRSAKTFELVSKVLFTSPVDSPQYSRHPIGLVEVAQDRVLSYQGLHKCTQ